MLGRMVREDIDAIARCRDLAQNPVSAWLFLGASPIRRFAEDWDRDGLRAMTDAAFAHTMALDLPVNFGIEDSARAEPAFVESLIDIAARRGVETVTLCDTVGCLVPAGVAAMVERYRAYVGRCGYEIQLDFHGHRDRAWRSPTRSPRRPPGSIEFTPPCSASARERATVHSISSSSI